ncbi:MAG: hypothetical protein AAGB31_11795 [Bdellovibrio sp.]
MGALSSYSKIYYGPELTELKRSFTIKEDGIEKVAFLDPGCYLPSQFPLILQQAINAVSSQQYSVSLNRSTRLLTISAEGSFEVPLVSMFEDASNIASLVGFTQDADLTGSNSYTSLNPCCEEYAFQFPLQSYLSSRENASQIQAVKKKTITGIVEATSFGIERQVSFEAMYITDIVQDPRSIIRTKVEAVAGFLSLLDYCIRQEAIEFMEDENRPDVFEILTLASTEENQNGLGYRLIEEYDEGLPNYYRSGTLTFDKRGV